MLIYTGMKILSNFDTELDKKVFMKNIEIHWDGNVLLIKRHPLFLYKAFLYWLLALIIFAGLISVIYFEYIEKWIYFHIFVVLHVLGVGLWILLLFKKILSHLWEYREFIRKIKHLQKIDFNDFAVFLKYSFWLFLYQIIVSCANIIFLYMVGAETYLAILHVGLNVILLVLAWAIIKRFIDFEMDFMIVTKNEIESFNQTGIFKRKVVSLDMQKFRTITTYKEWFWRSLFNIGSLTILSEGSSDSPWEIKFHYIHRLWALKKRILTLVQKNQN